LYELFLKEHRKKTVARLLNDAGYRTRNGSKFSDTTVDRLLRDPSARGLRRANYTKSLGEGKKWVMKPEKDWVLSEIEPIVSEELWDQCNRILDEQRAQRKPPAKKTVHLFSGLVYCEACGTKMPVPSKSSNYYCRKCHNKIGIADLEFIFQEQLKAFFLSPEEIAKHLSQADQTIKAKEELLATLMRESSQIREEMDKIMRLYLDGTMPQEAVGRHYKPLEERFKQLENQIPELQGEIDFLKIQYLSSDEIVSEATNLYSQWPNLEPEDKRRIVETITERISISGQDISIHLSYIPQSLNSSALATQPHGFIAARSMNFDG
jgi:site-specific DNA recombinase